MIESYSIPDVIIDHPYDAPVPMANLVSVCITLLSISGAIAVQASGSHELLASPRKPKKSNLMGARIEIPLKPSFRFLLLLNRHPLQKMAPAAR